MRKARRDMWETDASSKFRMIAAATANVKDGGKYEWVDVANDGFVSQNHHVTDFGEELKAAIEAAFKANEAALRDARPRQKHLGKDQFQVKPLTRAVLNKLPSLDQVLAVAPSNVASSSSPPRASWAPAVERYRAAFRAAKQKEALALKSHLPAASVVDLIREHKGVLSAEELEEALSLLSVEKQEREASKGQRARRRDGDDAPAPDARRRRGGAPMDE